jgi:hypothetical protein
MQRDFLKYAVNKRAMILQAAPGQGKTLAVMGLYLWLRSRYGNGKMLVITKKKAAVAFGKANVNNLLLLSLFSKGDAAALVPGYDFPADIYVMSSNFLVDVVKGGDSGKLKALTELLRSVFVLALDEVHDYRTYNSARSKAVKRVTDYFHKVAERDPVRHRLVGITATPVFKNIENLHPLFSLMCLRNPLGTWFQFVDRYCVMEQSTFYGSRKMYSANGSHSFKDSVSFNKIVGYKNVDDVHRIADPYIFSWGGSSFRFKFGVHYYELTDEEWGAYRIAIKGLGLDKTYAVDVRVGGGQQWVFRNRSDTFYMVGGGEVRTDALAVGMGIKFDGCDAVVGGVYDKSVDAGYSARVVKAQRCNSDAEGKMRLLTDLVGGSGDGVLIYFQFLESVDSACKRLMSAFPGRRVVSLTGRTDRFDSVVASIMPSDIVLMSGVASQSLDLYIPRLIVAECFGLTPGKVEQLVGRMTRENASYRDVSVDFILRGGENVESYFYEKLRLRLRSVRSNVYVTAGSLPASGAVSKIPDHLVDEDWLKKRLLWGGV